MRIAVKPWACSLDLRKAGPEHENDDLLGARIEKQPEDKAVRPTTSGDKRSLFRQSRERIGTRFAPLQSNPWKPAFVQHRRERTTLQQSVKWAGSSEGLILAALWAECLKLVASSL